MTREEIKKRGDACWEAFGGPMDEGLRRFTLYVEAVLDYIDTRVK